MSETTLEFEWRIDEAEWIGIKVGSRSIPQAIEARVQHAVANDMLPLKGASEVCVLLADDYAIAQLNHQWRGKSKPTNVLSFPTTDMPMPGQHSKVLGDIILAYETVEAEAAERKVSIVDHATHLVFHGLLHLLGYDHEEDEEAQEMETLERRLMASLSLHDPYSDGKSC